MTFMNVVLSILLLIAMPAAMGVSMCGILKYKASAAGCFTLGTVASWAVFQLISLPLILLKTSFTLLVIVVSVAYAFVILYGIIRYRYRPHRMEKLFENRYDVLLFILMILVFAGVLFLQARYTNIDDDDSSFVVNSIEMLRTDTMYRYQAETGYLITTGKLTRYAISPWAAYQAYLSKLTLLHPTILIHMVHPVALFLCAFEVQWRLSRHFVGEETRYRSLYCILLWLVMLYIGYNGWTAEGFLMKRVWQGKAVIAGIGIPYLLTLLLDGFDCEPKTFFPILFLVNFGLCLPSNMGMLLGMFVTGVYGVICAVRKKNVKTAIVLWLAAVPNVVYALLVKVLT